MLLNELLEAHSLKEISQKTNISQENLHELFETNFKMLKKVKTFGFISILEREYKVDLNALKQEASTYYLQNQEQNGFSAALTIVEEKPKGVFPVKLLVMILFGLATWYFLTQFDKKHFNKMIPFSQDKQIESLPSPKTQTNEVMVIDASDESDTSEMNESTDGEIDTEQDNNTTKNETTVQER